MTDQSSILRFIRRQLQPRPNWQRSFDIKAGTLLNMFDFSSPNAGQLLLDDETGEPK